jgi:hypothetical protein
MVFSMKTETSSTRISRRVMVEIERAQGKTVDYWDFKDIKKEAFEDSLFQYPAMMVPAMQRQVIAAILKAKPGIKTMADPFVGSGTILVQAMLAGKAFVGQDINPLAVLLSKTRVQCLDYAAMSRGAELAIQRSAQDRSKKYARRFTRQAKWFTKGANIALSRLYRAIKSEPNSRCRSFLWTCLAETVRKNSNSRTSTFKLHIRPPEERCAKMEDVLAFFSTTVKGNVAKIRNFSDSLRERGLLTKSCEYRHPVSISFGDSSVCLPPGPIDNVPEYDLVVTSPPYGDNGTTVPYGEAAWLPLQWIDLDDIDQAIPRSLVEGPYAIDCRSLGGRRSKRPLEAVESVRLFGKATERTIIQLAEREGNGLSRFVHFVKDLAQSVRVLVRLCSPDAYMVWTLGHRTISTVDCPLTDIVADVLRTNGVNEVARLHRRILSKRIPTKNNMSKTIDEEFILILRSDTMRLKRT